VASSKLYTAILPADFSATRSCRKNLLARPYYIIIYNSSSINLYGTLISSSTDLKVQTPHLRVTPSHTRDHLYQPTTPSAASSASRIRWWAAIRAYGHSCWGRQLPVSRFLYMVTPQKALMVCAVRICWAGSRQGLRCSMWEGEAPLYQTWVYDKIEFGWCSQSMSLEFQIVI